MPYDTLGDIQIAGEYLVYAIRTMHALAHRRIAVMGHSQGGMSMRWALRFWPDTRAMVDDVIGMAGTNHGTTSLGACCVGVHGCPPADWQQGAGSNFIAALNSGAETFAGISYTEIFTHTDEVVQPNSRPDATRVGAAHRRRRDHQRRHAGHLPADVDEHLNVGTIDPVAYALAMDALDPPRPGAAPRASPRRCACSCTSPGVNPLNVATYLQMLAGAPGLIGVSTARRQPGRRARGAGRAAAALLRAGVGLLTSGRPVVDVSANRSS